MGDTGILKRKYTEEIPESAKYKTPQASIPARRTQIKLNPDGKTSFGQNEIIRIMIPPQGYFDPEFSYLSFNVELTAPSQYKMKALEVWNDQASCSVLTSVMDNMGAIRVGKGTTEWRAAFPVPFVRHIQDIRDTTTPTNADYLFEWIPSGQIYPVLPYSAHGFFHRVVLRTANNTPIEDIQDYDYLSAHLGSLLQSQGYADTMGALLEGWGDVNTRAKYGLSCVKGLQYIKPNIQFKQIGFANEQGRDAADRTTSSMPYSDYNSVDVLAQPIQGLSPEGISSAALNESIGGMKFTCNLNLGIFQQSQNLPLLFSGGLILELYTSPFERCISFTSIFSRPDATDFSNLRTSLFEGNGTLVDVSAMNCVLPPSMTTKFGWLAENGYNVDGGFLDGDHCGYTIPFSRVEEWIGAGDVVEANTNAPEVYYLQPAYSRDLRLTDTERRTIYSYSQNGAFSTVPQTVEHGAKLHYDANVPLLQRRMQQFTNGWSYQLTNVELRADMVQFSQSYDESVAEIVDSDEGLPITFQTFTTQKATYNGQRQTITLNERARSIQFALAVFKDSAQERLTHEILYDNDTRFIVADYDAATYERLEEDTYDSALSNSVSQKFVGVANPWAIFARVIPINGQEQALYPNLVDYQFRVGTRFIPASPVDCSAGAVQAYIELMKAIGMYGSFSGTGQRANMPGNRITPDLYSKRVCTAASKVLAGAYYTISGTISTVRNVVVGDLESKDYVGMRYRIPQRFILGQNFSDIPDHASGVDTATQALSIELALSGKAGPTDLQTNTSYNCYVFMNVRRDMFVRCGGQIEILY